MCAIHETPGDRDATIDLVRDELEGRQIEIEITLRALGTDVDDDYLGRRAFGPRNIHASATVGGHGVDGAVLRAIERGNVPTLVLASVAAGSGVVGREIGAFT